MYNDISPELVQILIVAIGIIFAIVVYVVWRDRRILRKEHEALDHRVEKLRLGKMIDHLLPDFAGGPLA